MIAPDFLHSYLRRPLASILKSTCALAGISLAICLLSEEAAGQTIYTWGNTGTDWNTAADWNPNTGFPGSSGPPPATTSDVATFDVAATTNPNLSASVSIASVNFSTTASSGYVLSANSAVTLTLNSIISTNSPAVALNAANTSGANTISANLIFGAAAGSTQTVQQALGGTLFLTGNLSNTNALKNLQFGNSGLGIIVLAGTSTGLSAAVKLNGGTLVLSNDTALGSGTFELGTTSNLQSADATTRTIANSLGSFGGTSPTYTLGTSTTGDLNFSATSSASISNINSGTAKPRIFVVNNANTTISAGLTGSGSSSAGGITKQGSGNLILLGASSYAGQTGTSATAYSPGTTITAGTLTVGDGVTAGAALPTATQIVNSSTLIFNNASSDTSAIGATIVSTGTLTKNGAGSLTLSPLSTTTTAVSGQSKQVTVPLTAGIAVGAVVTGAGIPTNTTITSIGTTSGGNTTITLSNAPTSFGAVLFGNSISGNIAINSGTLIGNSGAGLSPALTLGTGNIAIGATGILGTTQPDQTLLSRITLAPAGSVLAFSNGFSGAATLDFSATPSLANITLGATSNVTLSSGTITPANNLYRIGGGSGILTVNGALLTGATNGLEVNGSVIVGTNPLAYGGSTTINNGGRLRPAAGNRLVATSALTVNPGGTLDLGNVDGGTTQTVASLAGAGLVTNSSSSTTAPNKVLIVNPGTGVNTTFSGIIEDRTASAVAGATNALTITGSGSLTLSGANTYSAGTTINGGTLLVSNPMGSGTGSGAVTVNGPGTLGGTGTISGATSINAGGKITGANVGSVGALTLSNNVAFIGTGTGAGLATYSVDLDATTSDRLNIGGTLDLSTTFDKLTFNALATPTAAKYILATYTGTLGGNVFDVLTNVPAGYSVDYSTGGEIDLISSVPEPATWLAGLGIVGMLGISRRKRLRLIGQ